MRVAFFRQLSLLLVLLFLAGCRSPQSGVSTPASPTAQPVSAEEAAGGRMLLALGDSLTEGLGVEEAESYPALLEEYLAAEGLSWRVRNGGVSGETSGGALSRLEWVLQLEPDAVLLVTGGNDGLRGIDPEVTRANISSILSLLKERRVPVMLAGMRAPGNLGPEYTEGFEALYAELAEEFQTPLIPFFLEEVAAVPELNQADRIHPNAEGYRLIVERIGPRVEGWLRPLSSARASSAP